jgi:hypothetical protein
MARWWRLCNAWLALAAAEPSRLHSRFGATVAALKDLPDGVVSTPVCLALTWQIAEGGVCGLDGG